MNGWIILWAVVLIVTSAIFAGLAIAVTVGGYFDLRALFKKVDQQHKLTQHEDAENVR